MTTSRSRITYDSTYSSQGTTLHFHQIQSQDLFINQALINAQGLVNRNVLRNFRQVYKPTSIFAMESTYAEQVGLQSGKSLTYKILTSGDCVYDLGLVFTLPQIVLDQQTFNADQLDTSLQTNRLDNDGKLVNRNTIRQICYSTNLGPALVKKAIFKLESMAYDQNNTNIQILVNSIMKRQDQRHYYNQLVGNVNENCRLNTTLPECKVYVPLKFFFSGSPQRSLQLLRGGLPDVYLQTEIRQISEVVCYTRNLTDFVKFNLTQNKNFGQFQAAGSLITEIYLSEQERRIHINAGGQQWLLEQNLYFKTNPIQNIFQPVQFSHPAKYLLWGGQKNKYQSAQAFLAYQPFIEGNNDLPQLLQDATKRFVLKYAGYIVKFDVKTHLGINDLTALTENNSAGSGKFDLRPVDLSSNSIYLVDVDFLQTKEKVIQSQFQIQDRHEVPDKNYSIDGIFQRLQAYAYQYGTKQRFNKDSVILQNGTLTIDEASRSVSQWAAQVPLPGTNTAQTALSVDTDAKGILQLEFALQSAISQKIEYPNGNYKVTISGFVEDVNRGTDIFCDVVTHDRFNLGLDDFDIIVNQYDNFGAYLDKTGSLIDTLEYSVSNAVRFKYSSFYGEALHQMNYFPGRTPQGVNCYSFALDPLSIQPSGTFNLTKGTPQFKIESVLEKEDEFFCIAVVYNVLEYRQQTVQVLYQTQLEI